MRCLLGFALCVPVGLWASSVTVAANSNFPLMTGSVFCHEDAVSAVSCDISPKFTEQFGRASGLALIHASADFGAASGSAYGEAELFLTVEGRYRASFSDYVTILGGIGSGVLVAHYELTSSNSAPFITPRFDPYYRFIQGAVVKNHVPNLIPPNPPAEATLTETFEVSSPFDFGVPLRLGAGTAGGFVAERTEFPFVSTGLGSRLRLTGYTVLDASGDEVTGVQVSRSFVQGPDVFVPEPHAGTLIAVGGTVLALLGKAARQRKRTEFSSWPSSVESLRR